MEGGYDKEDLLFSLLATQQDRSDPAVPAAEARLSRREKVNMLQASFRPAMNYALSSLARFDLLMERMPELFREMKETLPADTDEDGAGGVYVASNAKARLSKRQPNKGAAKKGGVKKKTPAAAAAPRGGARRGKQTKAKAPVKVAVAVPVRVGSKRFRLPPA